MSASSRLCSVGLCLAGALWAHGAGAQSLDIEGEWLIHPIPGDLQLGFTAGSANGPFLAEYFSDPPPKDDMFYWKGRYLLLRRFDYPEGAAPDAQKKQDAELAATTVAYIQTSARESCGAEFRAMSHRNAQHNGLQFSVSGGFCTKYASAAPYGEGAVVAVVQGRQYLFLIQYGWRPQSAAAARPYTWGAPDQLIRAALNAIVQTQSCGATHSQPCPAAP